MKLKTVKLTDLIGKNVKGVKAQVRNPIYVHHPSDVRWRILIGIETYKDRGTEWIELQWERDGDDSCNFTGCTIESNKCRVQFEPQVYKELKSSN